MIPLSDEATVRGTLQKVWSSEFGVRSDGECDSALHIPHSALNIRQVVG